MKKGGEASLKAMLIAEGLQYMKMGLSGKKKRSVYLQNSTCIFFVLSF